MHTRLGPWPHMLELREPLPGLSMRTPLITLGQMHALKIGVHAQGRNMPHAILHCCFSPDNTLEVAVHILAPRAAELVANGAALLLLPAPDPPPNPLPIPLPL